MIPPAFKYVTESLVEAYFRLGWTLTTGRPLYHRGGESIYLMSWLCSCPVVLPNAHHPNRHSRHAPLRDGETLDL